MTNFVKVASRCFAVLAVICAVPSASAGEDWKITLIPYAWIFGVDGTASFAGANATVNESVSDTIRNFDSAAQFHGEARHDGWIVMFDGSYSKVSKELAALPASFDTALTMVSLYGGYEITDEIDAYAGVRYFNVRLHLDLSRVGAPSVSDGDKWVDPVVGIRWVKRLDAAGRWAIGFRGDVGGFRVGSKLAWTAQPYIVWAFGKRFSAIAGWRFLDVDYEKGHGDNHFQYDIRHSGPGAGLIYQF